jgi:hypothetical protein
MNLRAEMAPRSEKNGSPDTEYSQGKGRKERIYSKEAKDYDKKLRDSQFKIGAAEIVRAQLEANPDVESLIQKIEREIADLKKEPKINATKLKLAQAKLERARQIQSENETRGTALRLVSTKYEKEWTPEALEAQNPRREAEMSALSERTVDIYEQQIEQEKQELQQAKEALAQDETERASIWKTWPMKMKIKKLEKDLKDHEQLIAMKRRMDKQEEEELRKTA